MSEEFERTSSTEASEPLQNRENVNNTQKKKKRFVPVVVIAAAFLVIAGLLFAMPVLANAARAAFSSPDEYYRYVEKKAAEEFTAKFSAVYEEEIREVLSPSGRKEENTLTVILGEELLALMETETGMELEAFRELSATAAGMTVPGALKSELALGLSGNTLLSGSVLYHLEEGTIYARIPELSERYLCFELKDVLGAEAEEAETMSAMLGLLYEKLPEGKELEALLNRYIALALSYVKDVEKGRGTLSAGEVSKEYTELLVTIDGDTMYAMAEAVLEAMRTDQELEAMVKKIVSVQEKADAEEVYDDFLDALEELIEQAQALKEAEEEIEMTLWVDNKGNIVGRKLKIEDVIELTAALPVKGNEFGCEVSVKADGAKVSFEGTGKADSRTMSGEFKLKVVGFRLAEITVEEVNVKKYKDGYFNGTVTIVPAGMAKELLEELGAETGVSFGDAALIVSSVSEKNKKETKFTLQKDGELFAAMTVGVTKDKGERISFPADNEVTKIKDEAGLSQWAEELAWEEFFEMLKQAGLPSEWVESLEEALPAE
ncbi:MAG: hypothetical protein ACI4QX_07460 [Lachnospiraceae bacterium]